MFLRGVQRISSTGSRVIALLPSRGRNNSFERRNVARSRCLLSTLLPTNWAGETRALFVPTFYSRSDLSRRSAARRRDGTCEQSRERLICSSAVVTAELSNAEGGALIRRLQRYVEDRMNEESLRSWKATKVKSFSLLRATPALNTPWVLLKASRNINGKLVRPGYRRAFFALLPPYFRNSI